MGQLPIPRDIIAHLETVENLRISSAPAASSKTQKSALREATGNGLPVERSALGPVDLPKVSKRVPQRANLRSQPDHLFTLVPHKPVFQ